jgi:hypothetical protein
LDTLKAYRLNPPILQAHCQSRTSQYCNQSLVKELAKPTQEKRNFKKCPTARQKTMNITATNRPTNHGRQGSTGGNTGFASGGVTCKLGAFCFVSSVMLVDSFVLPCLPAGREIRFFAKRQTECDLNQLLMKQVIECYLTDGRN